MIIDPEFKALIPPLQAEELQKLEESILQEGCRDALVVWETEDGDVLIDGHNRFAICHKHTIAFKTIYKEFASRQEVKLWMIRNQLARRNLTPFNRTELALQMESTIAEMAKQNQGQRTDILSNLIESSDAIKTQKELARIAETSAGNIYKVKQVLNDAPDAIKDKARSGDISIHRASLLSNAMKSQPQPVIDVALKYAGDDADKVAVLSRLYKSTGKDGSNDTFDEIAATGGFHYGEEMDDWLDFAEASYKQVLDALESIARYHKLIELQRKDADRESLKESLAIKASTAILPDDIQVHHADCTEFLRTLPDESIDLILIDPPYYNVVDDDWDNQWQSIDDYLAWCEQWMVESLRVMKPTANFYIWGTIGANSDSIIHQKLLLDKLGFIFRDWITWQKRRGRGTVRGWLYTREELLWYVKDNNQFIWNLDEQYGDEPNQFKVGMGGYAVKSEFKRITNVWTDIPEQLTRKETLHYTPKPQGALERIIKAHTAPGDLVLDFFSGSGSTGIASRELNRRCILVDADEQSYIESKARVGE